MTTVDIFVLKVNGSPFTIARAELRSSRKYTVILARFWIPRAYIFVQRDPISRKLEPLRVDRNSNNSLRKYAILRSSAATCATIGIIRF